MLILFIVFVLFDVGFVCLMYGKNKATGYEGPAAHYSTFVGTVVGKHDGEVQVDGDSKAIKTFYTFGYNGYMNGTINYVGGTICNSFVTNKKFHLWDTYNIAVDHSNPRYCTEISDWNTIFITGVCFLSAGFSICCVAIIPGYVSYYMWKFSEPKSLTSASLLRMESL